MGILDRFRKGRTKRAEADPSARAGSSQSATTTAGSELVERLLSAGQRRMQEVLAAHEREWQLSQAERWVLDEESGQLRLTFPDKLVTAPAQLLGRWSSTDGFLWGWAAPNAGAGLKSAAARVHAYGEEHRLSSLCEPHLPQMRREDANGLFTIALEVTEANGYYLPGDDDLVTYLTFGPTVTITRADGETREFTARP